MAIKQDQNGKWAVQVDRVGMPRTRRGGFESQEAAAIFEAEYVATHQTKNEQSADRRTLKELVELWHVCHGANLTDGRSRRRALMQLADDLKNPVAIQLLPEQFIAYRYRNTHGTKALTAKAFNTLHENLYSMFDRLKRLKVIDYTSPICDVDLLK